jgi:autotransporter-associated beta strand protein
MTGANPTVHLAGTSYLTGDVIHEAGNLYIDSDTALGSGDLVYTQMGQQNKIGTSVGEVTLNNGLILQDDLTGSLTQDYKMNGWQQGKGTFLGRTFMTDPDSEPNNPDTEMLIGIGGNHQPDIYLNLAGGLQQDPNVPDFTVVKEGSGVLELGGPGAYAGGTDVRRGTLIVSDPNALGTGDVWTSVGANAASVPVIKGSANIAGSLTMSRGELQPGLSVGTVSVAGDAIFGDAAEDKGAGIEFEIDTAANSDQLQVGTYLSLVENLNSDWPDLDLYLVGSDVDPNAVVVLVDNTTQATVGQFQGIPNDGTLQTLGLNLRATDSFDPNTVNSASADLSYVGGTDGYDIVLTNFVIDFQFILGDLNGDSVFNINDLEPMLIAIADAAQHDATWPAVQQDQAGDFDDNGTVNINDLQPFLEALASSNAVPEPASIALLSLGGLAILRRRRK